MTEQPDRLAERLEGIRRALAAVAEDRPTPEQIAEWNTADKEMAQRVRAALPGVPLHHAYAVLQAVRTFQRLDAAVTPAGQAPAPGRPVFQHAAAIAEAVGDRLRDTCGERAQGAYEVMAELRRLARGGDDGEAPDGDRATVLLGAAEIETRPAMNITPIPAESLVADEHIEPATDRAALRDRIAESLRSAACTGDCGKTEEQCFHERIQPVAWHHGRLAVVEGTPEQFADAVVAVLLAPTDRAAVYAEVADRLAADAEQGAKDGFTRIYRRSAAKQVRDWGEELGRVAAEPAAVSAVPGQADDENDGRPPCDHCGVVGHSFEDCPRAKQPAAGAQQWCKCPSCWGWFVEEHPGEDLDELGKDLSWWSGLPVHRDAPPAAGAQQPKEA